MARELRVRSPLRLRNNAPVAVATERKRKMPGSEQSLRRSLRGQDIHDEYDDAQKEISAIWESPLLIVTGLPRRLIGRDGRHEGDSQSIADGLDSATWEEKWLESPSKRRRIDRSFESWPKSPQKLRELGQRYPTTNNAKARKPLLHAPKPRAIERLSRSRTKSYSNTSSPAHSRGVSPDHSTRQSSLGPITDEAQTQRASPNPSEGIEDIELKSARSSPTPDLSPAASSVQSPEPPELKVQADSETTRQKDPDQLDPDDLPPPFRSFPSPAPPESYDDVAAQLLSARYPPITLPYYFSKGLSSHPPSKRSTQTLKLLAENAQRALRIWQDEYIRLDKKTAPVSLPFPKKPALGGRAPLEDATFEAEKSKDLYAEGSILAKAMGIVHPSTSKTRVTGTPIDATNGLAGGRELRRRRADAGIIDGLGISSDDAGAKTSKRMRKPVRRFDAGKNNTAADAATTKEMLNGKAPMTRRRRGPAPKAPEGQQYRPTVQRRGRVQDLMAQENMEDSSAKLEEEISKDSATDYTFLGASSPRASMASTARGQGKRQPSAAAGGWMGPQATRNGTALAPKTEGADGQAISNSNIGVGPDKGNMEQGQKSSAGVPPPRDVSPASKAAALEKKARAKSEKRSESMTAWWAARKKKAAEEKIKEMRERGEFREGTWNVDTIKSWTPSGSTLLPPATDRQPGFWIDQRFGPNPWTQPSWPSQANSQPNGLAPAPFPFPGYGYPMASSGGHVDRWGMQQSMPPGQAIHQQQRQPSFAHSPPQQRQSFSSGPPPLTADHPFAQRQTPLPTLHHPASQFNSRPEAHPPLRHPPPPLHTSSRDPTPFRQPYYSQPPAQPSIPAVPPQRPPYPSAAPSRPYDGPAHLPLPQQGNPAPQPNPQQPAPGYQPAPKPVSTVTRHRPFEL